MSKFLSQPILESKDIEILVGKNRGKTIHVTSNNYSNEDYNELIYLKNFSNKLTKDLSFFYIDEFFSINNIRYLITNNFYYNFSTITIIIINIGFNKNFPLITNFLWSYRCGDKINSITLKGEYKDLRELSEDPAFNNSFSPVSKKTSKKFFVSGNNI